MATPTNYMACVIVNPDDIVFESDVVRVTFPGPFGEVSVLPEHTPLYARINQGKITVWETEAKKQEFTVDGGILRAKNNKVTIIIGFDEDVE